MANISIDVALTEKIFDMSMILVVEDEPNVRKLVAVNLIKRGYEVLEAESGQQALAYLYERKPDLLILDVKLPDLSGWELLDRLSSTPDISVDFPVLVMTASQVDHSFVASKYPAVAEVMAKPFNTDKLISTVHRLLPKS